LVDRNAWFSKEKGGYAEIEGNIGGRLQSLWGGSVADSQKMSRAEAGRKGGRTTKQRYGDEHFGRIGRIGGKKGGETTKQRYGTEFYQKIGRIGGSR
jgi:general stress protein YciG